MVKPTNETEIREKAVRNFNAYKTGQTHKEGGVPTLVYVDDFTGKQIRGTPVGRTRGQVKQYH